MGRKAQATRDHRPVGKAMRLLGLTPRELYLSTGRSECYWRARVRGEVPLNLDDLASIVEATSIDAVVVFATLFQALRVDGAGRKITPCTQTQAGAARRRTPRPPGNVSGKPR